METYKLPNTLSGFQLKLYIHLINWKWKHITKEPGIRSFKGKDIEYDAILPDVYHSNPPMLYGDVWKAILEHNKLYYVKKHSYFNHMASSQAATANLFIPILANPKTNELLRLLKPDIKLLALKHLFHGYCLEFWDGNLSANSSLLGDHNKRSGTDSDVAIAYYNHENDLCLWLIEHKLGEAEFTSCGGYKARKKNESEHFCDHSFSDYISDHSSCYYDTVRKTSYWRITRENYELFKNNDVSKTCPFRNGLNQLWRNQLLGLAIEADPTLPFKHVFLSVVKHPQNDALDATINNYIELVDSCKKFSVLTSKEFVDAAISTGNEALRHWAHWYSDLYLNLEQN